MTPKVSEIIDPVAVFRAANGEREVYDAMTRTEKQALWNWVIKKGWREFVMVLSRLGLARQDATLIYRRAQSREGDASLEFDPEFWESLHEPPDVAGELTWAEFYGIPVKAGKLQFPFTPYDMTGRAMFNDGLRL